MSHEYPFLEGLARYQAHKTFWEAISRGAGLGWRPDYNVPGVLICYEDGRKEAWCVETMDAWEEACLTYRYGSVAYARMVGGTVV